jgi:predicted GNAT family acetyltransferase
MTHEVRRNDVDHRYELLVDGELVGIADFSLRGEAVVMPHTEIVAPRRGQGLGDLLVQGALDDIRTAGRTVVPACWFVAAFLDGHPEYADLRAA